MQPTAAMLLQPSPSEGVRGARPDPPYCVDYTGMDRPIHEGKPSGKDWSHVHREGPVADAFAGAALGRGPRIVLEIQAGESRVLRY